MGISGDNELGLSERADVPSNEDALVVGKEALVPSNEDALVLSNEDVPMLYMW